MSDPSLTLTVVGCGPAWTNPGEPCSSYLVEAGGVRILVDCGSGAFAALQEVDPRPLDAVVLSHPHFDHCGDLIPFAYSRMYAGLRDWPPPRLLAPPGGLERLAALAQAGGARREHLDGPFSVGEYQPGTVLELGAARLSFVPLLHPGVSYAVRIETGGKALCYSGDTGRTPALAAHARGVDALLCEATYADVSESDEVHLSAADAGAVAADAGAGRLVLVHVDADLRPAAVAAARTTFGGRVDAAVPGFRVTL